jgi:hypothetical protein
LTDTREPFAWAYIYEPQAHYDDSAPVLTFKRWPVVIHPWTEVPLYAPDHIVDATKMVAPDGEVGATPYQIENLDKLCDRIWSQNGGMTGKELLANVMNIMQVPSFATSPER